MGNAPTLEVIRARAAAGAERMDQHDPNWAFKVDPSTLVMTYYTECVLGRYFGSYFRGLRALGLTTEPEHDKYTSEHDAVKLGFDLAHAETRGENGEEGTDEAYRQLTDAWRVLVAERRQRPVFPIQRTAS